MRAKKEELVVSIRKGVRDNEIKKRRHINSIEVVETLPVKESTVPMSPLEIKIKKYGVVDLAGGKGYSQWRR